MAFRHRERSDFVAAVPVLYQYHTGSGVWLDSTQQAWYNYGTFAEYTDDVVSPKGAGRKQMHPTYHLTLKIDAKSILPYNWAGVWYRSRGDGYKVPINRIAIESLCIPDQASTVSFQDAMNKAFAAITQQMPEVVSIGNFMLELKELKDLIPKISLKAPGKTVSGGFLNFNFGWKPLIGDLQKLSSIVQVVNTRLQYLRDTAGKRVRVGYNQDLSYPDRIGMETYYSVADGFYVIYKLTGHKGTYTAGGYVYQELHLPNELSTQLKAYIGALGLNNPAKIIWNAIPYSFVVDWFTKIGGLLGRLSYQPFQEGVWQVSDVTFSYKETYTFEILQRNNSDGSKQVVGTGTMNRYSRNVGLPVSVGTSLLSLDPKQQLLALALIHQRKR